MEYLSGNWREEHLFNLRSALRLYDAVQAEMDGYEQKLQEDLAAAGGRGMQRGGVSAAPERGQGESHPKAG